MKSSLDNATTTQYGRLVVGLAGQSLYRIVLANTVVVLRVEKGYTRMTLLPITFKMKSGHNDPISS